MIRARVAVVGLTQSWQGVVVALMLFSANGECLAQSAKDSQPKPLPEKVIAAWTHNRRRVIAYVMVVALFVGAAAAGWPG